MPRPLAVPADRDVLHPRLAGPLSASPAYPTTASVGSSATR